MNTIPTPFDSHKKETMTAKEKDAMWAVISERTFLADIPAAKPEPIVSHFYTRFLPAPQSPLTARKYAFGVLIGAVAFSGGVSVFADEILPGSLLYPIKTNVVEKARLALAVTPSAKAIMEAALAATRLEEAEKLAAQGKLDAEIEQKTDLAFNDHVRKFNEHVQESEEQGKTEEVAEAGIFFQTRIAVHDAILNHLAINDQNLSFLEGVIASTTAELKTMKGLRPVAHVAVSDSEVIAPVTATTATVLAKSSSPTVVGVTTNSTATIDSKEAQTYLKTLRKNLGIASSVEITIATTTGMSSTTKVVKTSNSHKRVNYVPSSASTTPKQTTPAATATTQVEATTSISSKTPTPTVPVTSHTNPTTSNSGASGNASSATPAQAPAPIPEAIQQLPQVVPAVPKILNGLH